VLQRVSDEKKDEASPANDMAPSCTNSAQIVPFKSDGSDSFPDIANTTDISPDNVNNAHAQTSFITNDTNSHRANFYTNQIDVNAPSTQFLLDTSPLNPADLYFTPQYYIPQGIVSNPGQQFMGSTSAIGSIHHFWTDKIMLALISTHIMQVTVGTLLLN